MPHKDIKKRRESARKFYSKNKEYFKNKNQRIRNRNKKFLKDYLLEHPCVDCGFSDVRALEFDHVHGEKKKEVARLATDGVGLATLQKEIDKCEVRCANCHRIKTVENKEFFKKA